MKNIALIIGNSDGIGLAITGELLKGGWQVLGISRSKSPIKNQYYEHIVAEVQKSEFSEKLKAALKKKKAIDLCIYCAGIGEILDVCDMENEEKTIKVNLLGMVKTVSLVIPLMLKKGKGHFIGLSSVADEMLSWEAPGYHASKAGLCAHLLLPAKQSVTSTATTQFSFY